MKFLLSSQRSKAGFTLVEKLVTLAVIGIVTGVVALNFRSGQQNLALDRAAQKVAQDIRKTAERAIQTQQNPCGSGTLSGYGIHFDLGVSASYLIFAECGGGNDRYDSGIDEPVRTVQMEEAIEIASVVPNPLDIVFTPPDPTVSFIGAATSGTVTVQVRDNPAMQRLIEINQGVFTPIK